MPRPQPTPARLEAFSDGVIAVIITIMVLDLKVPHEDGFAGLRTVLPTLGVYALSFTFTGVYWVNHGHLVDRLHRVNTLILWTNLLFLFLLSLLPFFTSYVVSQHLNPFSVQVYAVSMMLTAFGFQGLSSSILRHTLHFAETKPVAGDSPKDVTIAPHHARKPAPDPEEHVDEIRKGWLSVGIYLLSFAVARWHPVLALGLLAGITLLWIVPGIHLRPDESFREPGA